MDGIVDMEFQQLLVDFMGWENYDLRIAPVQSVDLSAGESLMIDIEVLEEDRYAITLAVAGFDRSEVDIQVERGVLTVRGRK